MPVVATLPVTAADPINSLGLLILKAADYRLVALATLGLYLLLSLIPLTRHGAWPGMEESIHGVLGLLSLFGTVTIGCVFLLTKPPAIDMLSDDSRGAIGLVCVVVMGLLGIIEVRSVFFSSKKQ